MSKKPDHVPFYPEDARWPPNYADDKYHIPEYAPNYYPKFDNPHADMLMSISNEMALHASRRCKAEAQTVIGTHLWRAFPVRGQLAERAFTRCEVSAFRSYLGSECYDLADKLFQCASKEKTVGGAGSDACQAALQSLLRCKQSPKNKH